MPNAFAYASWGTAPHIFGSQESGLKLVETQVKAMVESSDEELMPLIAGGDQRAFRILARRHLPSVIRLARRLTGNHADAEDVAQDAMLRVWTHAASWRPSAAFRTWLYRVVVNLSIDRRRLKPMVDLEAAGDPADPAPGAAERIETDETAQHVQAALGRLPDRQRIALTLTHFEGLSAAEAAAVVGTTVGGIESLLIRARRTLRVALGPLFGKESR